jgi:hypothetical protein
MKYGDTILKGFATSVAVVSHRPVNLYLERAGRWVVCQEEPWS